MPTLNDPPTSFYFLLLNQAIQESDFFVPDPSKACILVPNFDHTCSLSVGDHPYRVGAYLQTLPRWNSGRNFLLFDNHDNPDMEVNAGFAIGAKVAWSAFNYRTYFDVSLPSTPAYPDTFISPSQWPPADSNFRYLAVFRLSPYPHVSPTTQSHGLAIVPRSLLAAVDTTLTRLCVALWPSFTTEQTW